MCCKLYMCLDKLSPEERELINRIYFMGYSLRRLSAETIVPYMTIQHRKVKILAKLKKLMESWKIFRTTIVSFAYKGWGDFFLLKQNFNHAKLQACVLIFLWANKWRDNYRHKSLQKFFRFGCKKLKFIPSSYDGKNLLELYNKKEPITWERKNYIANSWKIIFRCRTESISLDCQLERLLSTVICST